MGRSKYASRAPQSQRRLSRGIAPRSHLAADRELCAALKADRPKTFGVRRPVDSEVEAAILEKVKFVANDGLLPEDAELRSSLHVTLSSRRQLDRQLQRGLIPGYEFGKVSAAIEKDINENSPKSLMGTIGEVAMFKGRNIGLHVESASLEDEYDRIRDYMGRIGVKGILREPEPLHISLVTLKSHMEQDDLDYAIEALSDIMPRNLGHLMPAVEDVFFGAVDLYSGRSGSTS